MRKYQEVTGLANRRWDICDICHSADEFDVNEQLCKRCTNLHVFPLFASEEDNRLDTRFKTITFSLSVFDCLKFSLYTYTRTPLGIFLLSIYSLFFMMVASPG